MPLSRVLYITYDGITDPLGKSQVLPYLRKLSRKDVNIFLISFEKKINEKTKFKESNIKWIPVEYHKGNILIKALDIITGIWLAGQTIRKERIKIIHCRGYFSAFIAFCLKLIFRVPYIFDTRGLWVDEKVDGGAFKKNGFKYHIAKRIEKMLLISADKIVVLTHAMKDKLTQLPYLRDKIYSIVTIPTCTDLELFYPHAELRKTDNAFEDKFVVSYFGSIGTFYNFSAVIDFYIALSKNIKNAYLLIMSNAPISFTRQIILDKGISSDRFYLDSVLYEDVPKWLNLSDVSVIFYNREYSKAGCCPTKLGESLACGVPIVINEGIGDCNSIVKERNVGIVIKDFTEDSYTMAIKHLSCLLEDKENLNRRCRVAAEDIFSLDNGVKKYMEIYNNLA